MTKKSARNKKVSKKIQHIYHEERKKPKSQRRTRKQIIGKAEGMIPGGRKK